MRLPLAFLMPPETAIAPLPTPAAAADPAGTRPDDDTPPVRFAQIGKRYTARSGREVIALEGIDLTVNAGEICGVIGRSGAGKSTLLRLINRLEQPSHGSLHVQGTDIASLDEEGLVQLRRRVGMIFQHFNLLSAKTVWENIALPLRVTGMPRADIEERVSEVLSLVGLQDRRDAYPAQLSGGQKQRVGIARALVHRPGLLLSDEATSALDPETTAAILDLLRDINRRLGLTIVLITHEMSVIRAICDTVVVLDQGRIVERGRVADVFGAPQHPVTQALLSPLMHALPAELLAGLRASPPDSDLFDAVLSLRYHGTQGAAPDLSALSAAQDGQLRLLHANLDHLQAQVIGQLVVQARTSAAHLPSLLASLRQQAATVEILGYVQPTV